MNVFAWVAVVAIVLLALLFLLGMVLLLPTLDEEPDSEELWNDLEDLEEDN